MKSLKSDQWTDQWCEMCTGTEYSHAELGQCKMCSRAGDKQNSLVMQPDQTQRLSSVSSSFPSILSSHLTRWSSLSSSSLSVSSLSKSSSSWLWQMWLLLVLLVVVVSCENSEIPRELASVEQRADEYLTKFGYYQQQRYQHHKRHRGHHQQHHRSDESDSSASEQSDSEAITNGHTDSERQHAIERLQAFFHLPITGEVNKETRRVMGAARCGREDVRDEVIEEEGGEKRGGKKRTRRYAVSKYADGTISRWTQAELSWRITRPSAQISVSQQREAIRKSLAVWAQVVPMRFVEAPSNEQPDIDIQFVRREHGPSNDPVFDGRPIDRENVLAHAWGPGFAPKGLAGDVHFDEDDDWTKYDALMGVAVHELGHSMGLGHSHDDKAIMYPLYRDTAELGQDDRDGIKAVYDNWSAERPTSRPYSTRGPYYTLGPIWETEVPTTTPAIICATIDVDAVFEEPGPRIGQMFIAISGDHAHMLTPQGVLIKSQPLQNLYPDVPLNSDVAFSLPEKELVYFIKDDMMWAYRREQIEPGYPRSLKSARFPEKPQFSVNMKDSHGNSRLLLFGKSYWWMFDVDRLTAIRYDPISAFSRDMPADVLFAARWTDNNLYAVTRDSYVVLDPIRRQTTHPKPIAGKPEWLRALCGNGSSSVKQISTPFVMVVLVLLASLNTVW